MEAMSLSISPKPCTACAQCRYFLHGTFLCGIFLGLGVWEQSASCATSSGPPLFRHSCPFQGVVFVPTGPELWLPGLMENRRAVCRDNQQEIGIGEDPCVAL